MMSINQDLLRPKIGVGVIVTHEKKILLGKRIGSHGGGFGTFPGGHLEFSETPENCAQRELFEETGLLATTVARGPWVNNIFFPQQHYVTIFIFVKDYSGVACNIEPDKCEGWDWFEWDNLPNPLFPVIENLIEIEGINSLKSHCMITSQVSSV